MNIVMKNGTITINGTQYQGRSFNIDGDKVIIDGVPQAGNLTGPVSIQITGDVQSIDGCADSIAVTGSCGSVKTVSGDVSCGPVTGGVQTVSGDVYCGDVAGPVNTVSGDIMKTGGAA